MNEITYDNLSDQLVRAVPELKEAYEDELKWWGDEKPGQHVIYGDLLNPLLLSLLGTGEQEDLLRRIFTFLETLSRHEDKHVRQVVGVTVLERLQGNKRIWAKARSFMGTETLRIARVVEIYMADGPPLVI